MLLPDMPHLGGGGGGVLEVGGLKSKRPDEK